MPEEKKPERCPHCGYPQSPSLRIRTHCQKCGRPLKVEHRPWHEPGAGNRPWPSV